MELFTLHLFIIRRPSDSFKLNQPLFCEYICDRRPSISSTVTTVPIGNLHSSPDVNSFHFLHNAPGCITTLNLEGHLNSLYFFSSILPIFNLANVLVIFACDFGLIL
eukprot:142473_1